MEDRFRLRVLKERHSLKYYTDGIISVMDQMTTDAPLQDPRSFTCRGKTLKFVP